VIDPLKPKYFSLYWKMAHDAAEETVCTRHRVGAVVVTPTGMISPGWNGMPSGLDNECETEGYWDIHELRVRGKTKPEVVHAERNAIDKMTRQGIPTAGSLLFVTRAPCFECAKAIHGLGLAGVFYEEDHDDMEGVDLLRRTGNFICRRDEIIYPQ